MRWWGIFTAASLAPPERPAVDCPPVDADVQQRLRQLEDQLSNVQTELGRTNAALSRATSTLNQHHTTLQLMTRLSDHLRIGSGEVVITGANLRIENGVGLTDSSNGLGNLLIGYGLPVEASHSIIMGQGNRAYAYGNIATGQNNVLLGPTSIALGTALSELSSETVAIGGVDNRVDGLGAAAIGGESNTVKGRGAVLIGAHDVQQDTPNEVVVGENSLTANTMGPDD